MKIVSTKVVACLSSSRYFSIKGRDRGKALTPKAKRESAQRTLDTEMMSVA